VFAPRIKKRLLILTAIVLLIGGGLAVYAFLIEPNRLVVHDETIRFQDLPPHLKDLRIAAISDIHAGSSFINQAKLRQIVAMTNATKPDLIVLLGDYMVRDRVYRHHIDPEIIAGELKGLHAPHGVYAVLGNHDWWYGGKRVRAALEAVGITVLDNEVTKLDVNGGELWLAGLADLWTRRQDVSGTLAKIPAGKPTIALTHNPDVFPNISGSVLLTIAGHTHGGQVNLPLLGRRIVPSQFGERYAAGLVIEGSKHLFVTTGVGTSIIPVRFRVVPEIAVLTLSTRPG
jgi:hypothetical protein